MAVEQKKGDIKYLTPLNIDTSKQKKYCRFKKLGIKYSAEIGRASCRERV